MEAKSLTLKERVVASIQKVRPYLRADGGDIELVQIENGEIVKVLISGACAECEFLDQTMVGVRATIKKDSPEITEVIPVLE